MSIFRKLKKLALKSEILSLEEEELEEKEAHFISEFNKDFAKEIAFLNYKNNIPPDPLKIYDSNFPEMPKESLKKIYHKLARKLHPDVNVGEPNYDDENFKKIQSAYEKNDGLLLIEIAMKNNIEIDVDEQYFLTLEEQVRHKEGVLLQKKQSVRWVWCNSDKSEELRSKMKAALGIGENDFERWLETNIYYQKHDDKQ
jgi:hypothetical protein